MSIFILKEVIIKMIKKILLIGIVSVGTCVILLACGQANNSKIDLDTSNSYNNNITESDSESISSGRNGESNYKAEDVDGKAGIKSIIIENGQIYFQIKNLTTDNTLLSAYLEYVRLENGKEGAHYPLDCDMLNLVANDISDIISFNPQKPLGENGVIRIKELIFENSKDNYNGE